MATKIVLVTNEDAASKTLAQEIKRDDWIVKVLPYEDLMSVLPLESPDCLILSVQGAGKDEQLDVIANAHDFDDNLPVIVIARGGQVEDAVTLIRGGAYDYFVEPIDAEKIAISIANSIRLYKLTKRIYLLEQQAGWQGRFDEIIGHSSKMQEIFRLIETVAPSNATVLVLGASGTGKELVAKAIHKHSKRGKKSFIDINCGAIPRELLENELFGHERGSYTGADKRYIGSCERADGGTLFLDEICEMDPSLQVKILRLLQERSFNRVGGVDKITCDIRFIAATNKDIEAEVKNGNFREDLYYRLNVVPITIPPLKDRKEDILLIAQHFVEKFATKNEKIFVGIDQEAAECLLNYDWQGNVRELENMIERIVVLNNDSEIKFKHLPPYIQEAGSGRKKRVVAPIFVDEGQKIIPLELVEKYAIEAALDKCGGNVNDAASQLKIGQATLYRKIKQYGFNVK